MCSGSALPLDQRIGVSRRCDGTRPSLAHLPTKGRGTSKGRGRRLPTVKVCRHTSSLGGAGFSVKERSIDVCVDRQRLFLLCP